MFKTLFTTILLTCSLGTPSLKYEFPKKLNYTTIQGAYTFNDEYDYDTFFEIVDNNETVEIVLQREENSYNIFGINGSTYNTTTETGNIVINYDGDDTMYFNLIVNSVSSAPFFELRFLLGDIYNIEDIKSYLPSYMVENFVLSFRNSLALNNKQKALFNLFFTKGGNRYTTYYNGYYHFNNNNWYNGNAMTFDYKYGCYFMTNDGIYNCYSQNSPSYLNDVYFYSSYYDTEGQEYYNGGTSFYQNGTYKNNDNILITGLLPKGVYEKLNQQGIFQFVPNTQGSTWYEMILSTMDAPLYYLHGLLGFELFGMNLFVAFSSLLTVVIIITVIKKVV